MSSPKSKEVPKDVQKTIKENLKAGPEQTLVVGPLVECLVSLGWSLEQIWYGKKEWMIPKNPSEATKRQKGESFDFFPIDIAVFDDPKHSGNYRHLLFVIECKQPTEEAGLQQMECYIGLEPHVKLGIWANSAKKSANCIFVYKEANGLQLPKKKPVSDIPSLGSKIDAKAQKITYKDLVTPSSDTLCKIFNDMLCRIVASDANVTRREEQLDQMCNLILLKLHSDKQGRLTPTVELSFTPKSSEEATGKYIKTKFESFCNVYPDIFSRQNDRELRFSNSTIYGCVEDLAALNLLEVSADTVSFAFQVLRSAALKQEEGQYFTPRAVIEAAVKIMQIGFEDLIIDPACGTGGFLIQCLMEMRHRHPKNSEDISKWAQNALFGIDKDAIGIKLTKAVMQILGDGSAHCVRGDSVLTNLWAAEYPHLMSNLFGNNRFSVVFTNPPFGAKLTLSYEQAKKAGLDIVDYQGVGKDIELGLAVLNRCQQLLREDGRICIVLPETYFFSPSYKFVRNWIDGRFVAVGVVNVPMEAFQGFCRAKTNLYIFKKKTKTVAKQKEGAA